MRYKLLNTYTANATNNDNPVGAETPFVPTSECVLVVSPSDDFTGTVTVSTDNNIDSAGNAVFSTILNAVNFTDGKVRMENIILGDNVRVSITGVTAGSVDIGLLAE